MPHYRGAIDAELVTKAKTREIIVTRVRKMLRESNFDVKDFEWSVEALKPKEAGELKSKLERKEEPCPHS